VNCRSCGSENLWPFLDLGTQPIPRFPKTPSEAVPHAPLVLAKCESCSLVQLTESVARDLLFREFWYHSGISQTIRKDLNLIAEDCKREADLKPADTVLDIGCNDGTLLAFLDENMSRVGFEPSTNLAILAEKYGRIIPQYFSSNRYLALFPKAKLITAIAMFYDLEDPLGFCRQIAASLREDGVFIVQQNYLGLMLQNTAYDNVCHEHLTYFSLGTLQDILEKTGLEVYHVEINQINGGSIKTFIAKKGKRVVDDSVKTLELAEVTQDLAGRKIYRDFAYRVRTRARKLNQFLESTWDSKQSVMIYGAGSRGATIFGYSTLFYKHKKNIVGAVDNNQSKHGRYYLDTGIPIISRDEALKSPPDYFLLLPSHLAAEIIDMERENFQKTQWVIPLPEMRIV
jgi:NDP-4-keto-2,6-dideoxyhexose 3-C-methyltransferase